MSSSDSCSSVSFAQLLSYLFTCSSQVTFNESRVYMIARLLVPTLLLIFTTILVVVCVCRPVSHAHSIPSPPVSTSISDPKDADLLDDAAACIAQMYPEWTNYFTCQETICIPPCLEIFNKDNGDQAGFKAEEKFHRHFFEARCGLGGVLVANFRLKTFWNKVKSKKIGESAQIALKKLIDSKKDDFEFDFLFLHPLLGIYVIEVKGAEIIHPNLNDNHERYKKARSQVLGAPRKLRALFCALTGTSELECNRLPIRGVICFPNASLNNIDKHKDYDHLDKAQFSSPDAFKQFWLNKIRRQNKKMARNFRHEIFFEGSNELRFASIIIGFRSALFCCQGTNALEVHRRLHNQEFQRTRNGGSTQILQNAQGQGGVYLHQAQLGAFECTDKRQLIFGFLGSGKTMLIMAKVLAAARKSGKGRVLVAVHSDSLVAKYNQFFEDHQEHIARRPVVKKDFSNLQISNDDDFFADEAGFSRQERTLFKLRESSTGQTVVAVSGRHYPEYLPRAIEKVERREAASPTASVASAVSTYTRFTLSVVMRNTKAITNYWSPHVKYGLSIGHNIHGTPVEKFIRPTMDEVNRLVAIKVASLLRIPQPKHADNNRRLLPKDIAVLTSESDCLKVFLDAYGLKCGSVVEQLRDKSLVAVDAVEHTLSFEWAVVIFVDFYGPLTKRLFNHSLIASSRAMARLIVIELQSNQQADLSSFGNRKNSQSWIPPRTFGFTVRKQSDFYNSELSRKAQDRLPEEGSVFGNLLVSALRANIMWPAIRKTSSFANCAMLSDCLHLIVDDPCLLHLFVSCSEVFRLPNGAEKSATLEALKQRDAAYYYDRKVDSLGGNSIEWREFLKEFMLKWHDQFILLADDHQVHKYQTSFSFAKFLSFFSLSFNRMRPNHLLNNVGWMNTVLTIDYAIVYGYLPE